MLQMTAETMRELAHYVTEILVDRAEKLHGERAWEGDFKDALAHKLNEDPPDTGRPPREVIDRAVEDVLSNTLRLDHPRSFGFVPTSPTWPGVLADFMASGFNVIGGRAWHNYNPFVPIDLRGAASGCRVHATVIEGRRADSHVANDG